MNIYAINCVSFLSLFRYFLVIIFFRVNVAGRCSGEMETLLDLESLFFSRVRYTHENGEILTACNAESFYSKNLPTLMRVMSRETLQANPIIFLDESKTKV